MIYDAVSFLWQAKACFSEGRTHGIAGVLCRCVVQEKGVEKAEVFENVDLFALFRTLQVLGAYGFRGLVEKKSTFHERAYLMRCQLFALLYIMVWLMIIRN